MISPNGTNYLRMKANTGTLQKNSRTTPIFTRIRNQEKEMDYCVKKQEFLGNIFRF